MASNSPGSSQSPSSSDFSTLPRGLLCRKGVPVARGARLPSLRTPRDLTLGGATKRTFAPNIPARREKKEEAVKGASVSSPASERGRGSRRNQQFSGERGRGRGRGNNVIQLQGSVFGEGIAVEGGRRKGPFGQSSHEESSSSRSVPIPKFTPNNKSQTKEQKEEEEAKLNELLRDDFLDWNDEVSDIKPVQLPLLVKGAKVKDEADVKVKMEPVSVKKEPLSDGEEEGERMEVDADVKPRVKLEVKVEPKVEGGTCAQDPTAARLFSSSSVPESGQLLFFQFPDCLPGASGKSDEDPRIKKEQAASSAAATQSHQAPEETSSCVLSDLPEGFIGKLQILKSGRTRLLLGSVCLNVELGTPLSFLQDLVSVRFKEGADPTTGNMFVLGHVQEKLVCLPDMDTLLRNVKNL